MYEEITNINISLQTSPVSQASFGIPIFISKHVWFPERVRVYNNISAVADDVPTDSSAYKAAASAFAVDVPPKFIKLGRRSVDSINLTAEDATTIGQITQLTVVDSSNASYVATFTSANGTETSTEIIASLVASLGSITDVTVVDNLNGTMTLARSGTEDFSISSLSRLTYSSTSSESAEDTISAIEDIDNDFYFVAAEDHSDTYVMAMADAIQSRDKQYFVALQNENNLGTYSDTATHTVAKLRQEGYSRTSAWYHHDADSDFPEMTYVSVAAPSSPGKKVWANNQVEGSAAKANSTSGNLTTTQKNNLVNSYANFTEVVGGITITRYGYTSSGHKIDIIRNRDFLKARLNEAFQQFLINRPVVPYTQSGIDQARNILETTLGRYKSTAAQPNILDEDLPFVSYFPNRSDVSFADVANGNLNAEFVAYLAGSMLAISITGVLTYNTES